MCNCIDRVEKQLTEKMIELNPGCEVLENVEIQNKSFLFERDEIRPYNPVLGRYKVGNKVRKFETSMIYTFCPFCGQKYEPETTEK